MTAVPTLIGTNSAKAAQQTIAVTVAAPVPAGALVVVCFGAICANVTPACSDSRSNGYTWRTGRGSGGINCDIFYCRITTGLQIGDTITGDLGNGSGPSALGITAFYLNTTAAAVDQQTNGAGTSASPTAAISGTATAPSGDLYVGFVGWQGATGDWSAEDTTHTWTGIGGVVGTTGGTDNTNYAQNVAYKLAVTGNLGSQTYAPSLGASVAWAEPVNSYIVTPAAAPQATITLDDPPNNPLATLSNLHWAWWDTSDVNAIAEAPVAKGATESTNGSGVMVLDLTGTTLTSGQKGTLLLHAADWSRAALLNIPVD